MADLHAVLDLVLLNDVLSPESRTYFKNLNETSVQAHTIVHEVLQNDDWTKACTNRGQDFIANMPHYIQAVDMNVFFAGMQEFRGMRTVQRAALAEILRVSDNTHRPPNFRFVWEFASTRGMQCMHNIVSDFQLSTDIKMHSDCCAVLRTCFHHTAECVVVDCLLISLRLYTGQGNAIFQRNALTALHACCGTLNERPRILRFAEKMYNTDQLWINIVYQTLFYFPDHDDINGLVYAIASDFSKVTAQWPNYMRNFISVLNDAIRALAPGQGVWHFQTLHELCRKPGARGAHAREIQSNDTTTVLQHLRRNFSAHSSIDAVLARQQTGTAWGVLHFIANKDKNTDACQKIAVVLANSIRLHSSETQHENDNDLEHNWHCFLVSMLVDVFHA